MEKIELFNCSDSKAFSIISKFWDKYGEQFPLYYQKYFKANIFDIIENNSLENVDEITKSIINYLGLLSFDADKESQFLSFFEQLLGANELYGKNIVSTTRDYLPTMSKKIISENKHAAIRTYGPNIITARRDGVNTFKKAFLKYDLTDSDDILVSFDPRENIEMLVYLALESQRELLLNLDGYIPDRSCLFKRDYESFLNELYKNIMTKKSDNFDADIISYSLDGDRALVLRKK